MHSNAVVFDAPYRLALRRFDLPAVTAGQVVVDMAWTGISTGTERLLWSGRMPPFPGLGYPLVPGYEAVGRVSRAAGNEAELLGRWVFVPGANCYGDVRGLFGGAASRVVVDAARIAPLPACEPEQGVLLALAATAMHALAGKHAELPELIVGHGVFGRLLARLTVALGGAAPVVWERQPARRMGATGYQVIDPATDSDGRYRTIIDASGDAGILDTLMRHLAPGGEIVLAGFYAEPVKFDFPPAFMREARLRIAAEWQREDLTKVSALVDDGLLDLSGLITHRHPAANADSAYTAAFEDAACLKMILDWSTFS